VAHSSRTTIRYYVTVYARLKKAGTSISTNELWIAVLAIKHSLILYSRDAHFDLLPSIPKLA
jgi:tRNA(fMet)-specific endonuclease VapC